MITILFSSVLVIHAFLHLIGFAKDWNLISMNKFTYRYAWLNTPSVRKVMGAGWFLACVSLLTTSYFYFVDQDGPFQITGILSLILSQTLISLYWQEAKFGTLINWMLLLAIIITYTSSPDGV